MEKLTDAGLPMERVRVFFLRWCVIGVNRDYEGWETISDESLNSEVNKAFNDAIETDCRGDQKRARATALKSVIETKAQAFLGTIEEDQATGAVRIT